MKKFISIFLLVLFSLGAVILGTLFFTNDNFKQQVTNLVVKNDSKKTKESGTSLSAVDEISTIKAPQEETKIEYDKTNIDNRQAQLIENFETATINNDYNLKIIDLLLTSYTDERDIDTISKQYFMGYTTQLDNYKLIKQVGYAINTDTLRVFESATDGVLQWSVRADKGVVKKYIDGFYSESFNGIRIVNIR